MCRGEGGGGAPLLWIQLAAAAAAKRGGGQWSRAEGVRRASKYPNPGAKESASGLRSRPPPNPPGWSKAFNSR